MNNRLKFVRKQFGLTQEGFSEIIGISRIQVARLKSGTRKLSMDNAALYAEKLEQATGRPIMPMEFFVDLSDIGARDKQELELLNIFRSLSEKDRSTYLQMANAFDKKDKSGTAN